MEELDELPASSEALQGEIRSWLAKSRTSAAKVKQVLGLLDPVRLGNGAEKYERPEWRKDGPPSMYRAHWRHQACQILGTQESAIPENVTVALKAYLWPTALDTKRADHTAWIIKVPKFVSRVLHDAAAANKQMPSMEDDMDVDMDAEEPVGTVRIFVDPFQADKTKAMTQGVMELTGKEAASVPKKYILANQATDMPMHVFSDVREGLKLGGHQDITLEARIDLKLDMRPSSIDDVDYNRVSKERMEQAQTKTRVTQSSSEMRFAPLPKRANLVRFTADAVGAKTEKKERMEKKALENLLFGLFEKQPYWSMKQLLLESKQPADWLKTNLSEIAILTRRGPNMGLWGLKPEWKQAGAPEQMS
ncbi:Transcription initiation factor IIF, beta subunit [Ostreococcus tauri]|uniref:Transcription initiation factor IIF, beta subunit n=1 Tax=Ostreococcus tauri TaxID=70448 RepID=A0A096PBU5_OSTTA|nr:Transcription initiation factor IIF, beta subunit [Ostreococcus tauri]CEG02108.1 Transcription initiation factor IIF, beta subunit [Ostreococcus tauri]|eukprot:XP_022841352.1 Transcription initiation factor IIF, beta subunit [Ostreococcus tauri]